MLFRRRRKNKQHFSICLFQLIKHKKYVEKKKEKVGYGLLFNIDWCRRFSINIISSGYIIRSTQRFMFSVENLLTPLNRQYVKISKTWKKIIFIAEYLVWQSKWTLAKASKCNKIWKICQPICILSFHSSSLIVLYTCIQSNEFIIILKLLFWVFYKIERFFLKLLMWIYNEDLFTFLFFG